MTIYEVRFRFTKPGADDRVSAFGSYKDRAGAEQRLSEENQRLTELYDRWRQAEPKFASTYTGWIEEIDQTNLFQIPPPPTPRLKYRAVVETVEHEPAHWRTSKVRIETRVFMGQPKVIGTYERNYGQRNGDHLFEPFRQGGREYALISPHYTATSVMDLATGEIIAAEEPASGGFCPVGFYVPDWWDVHDGSVKPGTLYWDEDDEWPVGDFGFVWGCHWGDDSSWKVQYLDLSRVAEGVITRDDRFGYVELATHREVEPREFIRVYAEGRMVKFWVEQYHRLGDGKDLRANVD